MRTAYGIAMILATLAAIVVLANVLGLFVASLLMRGVARWVR